jgi:hypothetical protein
MLSNVPFIATVDYGSPSYRYTHGTQLEFATDYALVIIHPSNIPLPPSSISVKI